METKKDRNARRMREWRLNNPELAKARDKIRNDARYSRTRAILEESKNKPCMDCGIQYPFYVMQFDHRDPTLKLFSLGREAWKYSVEKIKTEIDKCDVVCSNCHAERTHVQRTNKLSLEGRTSQED